MTLATKLTFLLFLWTLMSLFGVYAMVVAYL